MEKFNKHLADSDTVAMVHASYDREDDAALVWAQKEKFPWLTILPSKFKESQIANFSRSDYVPEYQIYDAEGKPLAEEGEAAIAKAIELAGEEDE
ncbi:MAG: hypothetical protein Q7Q71_01540 [Verrucomicrobiota bacterium JB023]|nr:hypothetical protein [Verrucomicrobiota bacterium JB023]